MRPSLGPQRKFIYDFVFTTLICEFFQGTFLCTSERLFVVFLIVSPNLRTVDRVFTQFYGAGRRPVG